VNSTYRTANGKVIDIDALRLKNEEVIALGNMRVNARGDDLGPGGRVVRSRNQKTKEQYNTAGMVDITLPEKTTKGKKK
jgi:hypothetical protein